MLMLYMPCADEYRNYVNAVHTFANEYHNYVNAVHTLCKRVS